jgi:hypothetical protein
MVVGARRDELRSTEMKLKIKLRDVLVHEETHFLSKEKKN